MMMHTRSIVLGIIFGLMLAIGGVFLYIQMTDIVLTDGSIEKSNQPTQQVQDSTSTVNQKDPVVLPPTKPSDSRVLLSLEQANARISGLVAEIDRDWNTEIVSSRMTTEPMMLENGRKVHIPYDSAWGNAHYELDTIEVSEGAYYFGPMIVSEMLGAVRLGSLREARYRTLDEALKDASYTSQDCSGEKTFSPIKIRVGNVNAVRFEAMSCEGGWTGYEIQFGDRNLIITDSHKEGDELSRWVLERM